MSGVRRDDNRMIGFVLEQLAEPDQFVAKVRELYSHPDRESRDLLHFKDGRVFDRFSAPLVDGAGEYIGRVWYFRDITDSEQLKQVRDERARLQQEVIEAQQRTLRQLSSPLLPIASDAVAMPLVGEIDAERGVQIVQTLVDGVSAHQAEIALLDLTGVSTVDTAVANALVHAATSCGLLGAEVVLTGIQPKIAQILVRLGIDLSGVITKSTLQAGIEYVFSKRFGQTQDQAGNGDGGPVGSSRRRPV